MIIVVGHSFPVALDRFTATTVGMAHSAGTGTPRRFFISARECNTGTISVQDGGSALSTAQQNAIQSTARSDGGSGSVPNRVTTFSGPGIVYSNNVVVMWNTSAIGCGFFTGRHQFGQTYLGTNTAGTVTAFADRRVSSSISC